MPLDYRKVILKIGEFLDSSIADKEHRKVTITDKEFINPKISNQDMLTIKISHRDSE